MTVPIRVLIAKPGLDGHDRGALVVAQGLRDEGMEVIYTGIRQSPAQIVSTAIQEDVACIGLSSLSGAHMELFPEVARLLRQQGADDILLIGGGVIPDEDTELLKSAGIEQVFRQGSTIKSMAEYIRQHVHLRGSEDWAPLAPLVKKIDHVGVAVRSIQDALPFYTQCLRLSVVGEETLPHHGVRVALLATEGSAVELLEPLTSESALTRHLSARGPGVHHIAYEVDNLAAVLRELRASGIALIDEVPRLGARGHLVAFVHPKSAGGALTELVQSAGDDVHEG